MTYQSMTNAHDGLPLLRNESRGTVEVVEERADGIDELNGSSVSRRSRKGAALGLIVLAVGAVSALSVLGGKPSSSQSGECNVCGAAITNLAASETGLSPRITAARALPRLSDLTEEEKQELFEKFGKKFLKSYSDEDEKAMRFEIFKRNLKRVDEKNANSRGVKYDVTMWADLTREEFKSYQNYGKISDEAKDYARSKTQSFEDFGDQAVPLCQSCTRFPELAKYVYGELPTEFDWRDYGAVTEVKNQAYCGSCWSFSTTGCLEGAWFLAGNPLTSLSEQQLVACDTEWNQGCQGGWPSLAMDYISENGGIVPGDIYPYRKVYMGDLPFPTCSDTVKDGNYAATLSFESSLVYGPCAEDLMARWLIVNGPLSVALDAMGMEYYSDGIDMGEYCTPLEIDHAVLIVGYGEEDGVKYWIIKNSWKYTWGEEGYYRLVRGVNACGIAEDVTTIIVGDATVAE
ncbi:unnamed protein product [Pylaiella littoralis]